MVKNTNKITLFKHLITIYGIGKKKALKIHQFFGLNQRKRPITVQKNLLEEIKNFQAKFLTEQNLKQHIYEIINFSKKINTYRGLRNKLKYPCRGQRTHTNAKTKQILKTKI